MGADECLTARSLEVLKERAELGKWDAPDICIEAVGHQMTL
jgi:hypothetical protein